MGFDLGDTVPLGIQVKDDSGDLTDPSSIALTITLPDGTSSTPTPTKDSTGLYSHAYTTTQAGRHLARWVTESPDTAYVDAFDVSSAAPPLIVSLADAKRHLNIPLAETDDDEELRGFVEALSGPVEAICGAVVRRSVTNVIHPRGRFECPLPVWPVVSITSAVTKDSAATTLDTSQWWVSDAGVLRTLDGTPLPCAPVSLTCVVGRAEVPAGIRVGALHVLKLAWRTQRGNAADAVMGFLVANAAREWFAGNEQPAGFA